MLFRSGALWAVCCAHELGRRAHATRGWVGPAPGGGAGAAQQQGGMVLLPPPTPPGFPLDFSQLLQATAATPPRARARGSGGKGAQVQVRTERIVEEEDGWDLLDDDLAVE